MKELLDFDFCNMTIYDTYIVVVVKEGVNLTPKHNNVLIEVAETYFQNKPFVYITNRVNSYSVDPQIYYETSKIDNLIGFAVVSKDYKAKKNAEIEKLFFKKPFEVFTNLEDATSWTETLLLKAKKD